MKLRDVILALAVCCAATPSLADRQKLVVPADTVNQCYVDALAGSRGSSFRFLLDTGDGAYLSFTRWHLKALGFERVKLNFDGATTLVWGHAPREATITLPEFRLRNFVLHDVEAKVLDANSNETPTIGVGILKYLDFRITQGYCVLMLPDGAS